MDHAARAGFRPSPQQRYLWSAAAASGVSPWVQLTVALDSQPDVARLERVVRDAVAEHEILRTAIRAVGPGAGLAQVIDEEWGGTFRVAAIVSGADGLDRQRAADREQLDVSSGRSLLATVLAADGHATLILTAHPAVADRRSLRLLLAEIVSGYRGRPGPPVLIQQADFAAWHNDLLADESRAAQRQYWDRLLTGEAAARTSEPPLLGAREMASCEPGDWHTQRRFLDSETSASAEVMADRAGCPVEAVLAAAWGLLLWRMYGECDIAVPVAFAGRAYDDLRAAIGPFARYAPVRFGADGESSFGRILQNVASGLAGAAENLDDLDPGRLDLTLPAQVPGFEYLDDPGLEVGGGAAFLPVHEECRGEFAVVVRAGRGAAGMWTEVSYDAGRADGLAAGRLLERFTVLLRAALAEPAVPVGILPVLVAGERERLIARSRGPAAMPSGGRPLHAHFQQAAARSPAAVAVQHGTDQLTYADLDGRSNQLARYLAARGVKPGDRVLLHLDRRPEIVVALLGVIKAGAAFVPADTRLPRGRIEFLLRDTAAPLIITCQDAGGVLLSEGFSALRLDSDWADIAAHAAGPLPETAGIDAVAYVMYTSGTTGVPNGVPVTHRALLNYLLWATNAYDVGSGSGVLVHSGVGFDLTLTGLLAPLLTGQRTILVPEETGLGGLAATIGAGHDLTMVKLTPSHLRALAQIIDPAELAGRVRVLVVGGEELRAETIEPFRRAAPGMRIVNEYGPTETVVGCCCYEVTAQTPAAGPVPVGGPIAGTSAYLLDAAGEPVPDGVPGEIGIGGVGVGVGYLNRPEPTHDRFLADRFAGTGQLYRTGDRARWLPGAGLVYLGRSDGQLKVRGVRVEAGEIEAVLCQHPDVGEAAVAVAAPRDDGHPGLAPGGERLTAYLVPAAGRILPNPGDLADFCGQRLSAYLVPAVYMPLAALPVTPNGKLDRRSLPEPPEAVGDDHPPRNETEEILAGAVATVLGRERVGIDDNYFVIGGDSIRSVMIASRARERGVPVSVADLHAYPTVRRLAEALASARPGGTGAVTQPFSLVPPEDRPMLPADVEDAFPLNLLQEGMIFHRSFAAKSAVYHAIASIRLRAPFDLDVLRRVIRQLTERHPMLRTSFDLATFSRPLQLVHKTFADPLSYQDLRGLPPDRQEAEIARWVARERERGFELDEYPLIRFLAQRIDDQTFQFTYGFHHEIVDGWSEALLISELFGQYFSVIFDEPVTISPPRASMRDAVALELEALGRRENYEFWDRYLAGATLMRLPRPYSAPHADRGAREIVRVAVPVSVELSDRLKQLAIANAVPLKSVLLAAHLMVMCQYHGQLDTLTYTVTNGRPETADGSTAIGLFVNSLAVRLAMTGGTWNDLITRTLETERESMPYRRLPMAELKRHQGNEPLAETLFFFTDYHIFRELDRWRRHGIEHMASELYGESTFPFCAIFRLNRDNARLEVRLEYDGLQFPADLMDRVRACYERVLEIMSSEPESCHHTRSLLSEQEEHQALVEWSATGAAPDSRGAPIHRLIERRAAQSPDAVAIEHDDNVISYGGLDRLAGRIAWAVRVHGAGPERIIAVMARPGPAAVAGMLGVLRAGAAYLPLDPALPAERVAAILRDARPDAILVEPELASGSWPAPVVLLDLVALPRPAPETPRPPSAPALDNPAYVIYTSGSTGQPKGVIVTHRGLLSSTLARGQHYPSQPGRFLLLSPLVFDSSVAGLFWTLWQGGTLVLPSERARLEPAALARCVGERGVSHTLGVPSLLAALLLQGEPEQLQSLRVIISAGESCPKELLGEQRRVAAEAVLYNEYGPTENTVWSTVWSGEPLGHRVQLPIGRPTPGVVTYVLNPHLQPVPAGVGGELYLGGEQLSRGYLGRPGLTAAAFGPDPLRPGARMYRSGDLARHTPDGELEFLGRSDDQVKIRGFRVEPGEVEGLLDSHPHVRRSVVTARPDATGEKKLVAYVTVSPGADISGPDLQQYAREHLPKYMVPAACVVLERMPVTATGKVDLASLPVPGRPAGADPGAILPRTEVEQVAAAIWGQVLGVDRITVRDDFFDLGGESLAAMQAVIKVNKVFGLDVPVRVLFDAPALEDFCHVVQEEQARRVQVS